jgi:hypothetical protein
VAALMIKRRERGDESLAEIGCESASDRDSSADPV